MKIIWRKKDNLSDCVPARSQTKINNLETAPMSSLATRHFQKNDLAGVISRPHWVAAFIRLNGLGRV
jgi:hypothetical protein